MSKYHRLLQKNTCFLSFIANQHRFVGVSVKTQAEGYIYWICSPKFLPKMPPQWSTHLGNISVADIPDLRLEPARFVGG